LKYTVDEIRRDGRARPSNPGWLARNYFEKILAGGELGSGLEFRLGETFRFDDLPPEGQTFRVRLVDREATAMLHPEGGEAFRLAVQWGQDGPRLVHRRYLGAEEPPATSVRAGVVNPLADPQRGSPARLYYAAHRPLTSGNDVEFLVSVQNDVAEQASPRPREVWIEILPQDDAGSKASEWQEPFVFTTAEFVPDLPVPVVRCRLPHWPGSADTARIKVWCKFARTPAVVSRTLTDLLPRSGGKAAAGLQVKMSGDQSVEFTVAVLQEAGRPGGVVRVVEQHAAARRGVFREGCRVELAGLPKSDEVRRVVSPRLGRVEHSFEYQTLDVAKLADATLEITPREALLSGAAAAGEPLIVRGFLPPWFPGRVAPPSSPR